MPKPPPKQQYQTAIPFASGSFWVYNSGRIWRQHKNNNHANEWSKDSAV